MRPIGSSVRLSSAQPSHEHRGGYASNALLKVGDQIWRAAATAVLVGSSRRIFARCNLRLRLFELRFHVVRNLSTILQVIVDPFANLFDFCLGRPRNRRLNLLNRAHAAILAQPPSRHMDRSSRARRGTTRQQQHPRNVARPYLERKSRHQHPRKRRHLETGGRIHPPTHRDRGHRKRRPNKEPGACRAREHIEVPLSEAAHRLTRVRTTCECRHEFRSPATAHSHLHLRPRLNYLAANVLASSLQALVLRGDTQLDFEWRISESERGRPVKAR
jgi:hypothetical protein